jgi:hypothetical protein
MAGKIQYQTFQKHINLFLYIPVHSTQPPRIKKSLNFGFIHTSYRKRENLTKNVKQLFGQLIAYCLYTAYLDKCAVCIPTSFTSSVYHSLIGNAIAIIGILVGRV